MIVDLALEPESLIDISAGRLDRVSTAVQRTVIDTLRAHGALVFADEDEIGDLVQVIAKSPMFTADERARWKDLLLFMRDKKRLVTVKASGRIRPKDVSSQSDVQVFAMPPDETVLVLQAEHFDQLFPTNPTGIALILGGTTTATAATFPETALIERHRSLAMSGSHPHGYSRDEVWREVFAPAARLAKQVTILDPYLFGELQRRRGRDSRGDEEHVIWILDRIASEMKVGSRVRLIAASVDSQSAAESAQDALNLVMQSWSGGPGSIVELEVVMASRIRFPHNRHIRFDGLAFLLEEGMDRLSKPKLWDLDGLNWKYQWTEQSVAELRSRETRAEHLPTAARAIRSL